MKSLRRWSTTIGLAGSIVLGTVLSFGHQVLALTQAQVVERLRPVPVFTLTDAQGAPLVASPREGQQGPPVAGVFISQQDAQSFLNNLRQNNPNLAQNVRITPVSLAEIYELALRNQNNTDLEFAFVPMRQEVETALSILRQSGQNTEQFQGVPLFVARSSGQDGGYLTIQQGQQQVIPMFFKRDELQALIDRIRQQQPNVVTGVTIQVLNLEGLIETFQNSTDDDLTRIFLIPPRESIEFVRNLQPAPGQQRPAAPQGQSAPQGQQRPAAPQGQQRPAAPQGQPATRPQR